MPTHEFGIMYQAPNVHEVYNEYEPWEYGCISVDDVLIEKLSYEVKDVVFYWHTTDRPGKGLAYCGITLIPTEAMDPMLDAINAIWPMVKEPNFSEELNQLKELLQQAREEECFIIHFGI